MLRSGSIKAIVVSLALAVPGAVVMNMSSSGVAVAGSAKKKAPPTPDGYDAYLVFLGNGELTESDPLLLETTDFYDNIMGFSEAEFEAFKTSRLDIFESRFGIVDPENNPDIFVLIGQTNPKVEYRAYTVGDRKVPSSGWEIREGIFTLFVTNPAGIDLGGEFAGTHVPAGTIFGSGIYNIEVTDKWGCPTGEEIIIPFSSSQPILPQGTGNTIFFLCNAESDEFGPGLAQGISAPEEIAPGIIKQNIRNVVTFSNLDGL